MKNKIIILVALAVVSGTVVMSRVISSGSRSASQAVEEKIIDDKSSFKFEGEKGELVAVLEGKVQIPTTGFETNKVRFFNTKVDDGSIVYYLVLKDADGNFRIAANANEQCAQYGKGYKQEGDQMVCPTCNKRYPVKDFAIEQPDCNPKPLTAKAEVVGGYVNILSADLQKLSYLFN